MDNRAIADQLVSDFGTLLTVNGLGLSGPANNCALVFDNDLVLNIAYDANSERLVFSLFVADLVDDAPAALHKMMMASNVKICSEVGAALAIDEEASSIILLSSQSVETLDNARFEKTVERILNLAEKWQRYIGEYRAKSSSAAAAAAAPTQDGYTQVYG